MEVESLDDDTDDLYACHRGIDGGPRWECSLTITCDECGTEHPSVSIDGDLIVIACDNCAHYWNTNIDGLFTIDPDTGEIRVTSWSIPLTFEGRPNRW